MKYCLDTWFFKELRNKSEKAIKIWEELRKGKSKAIIPTPVLMELTKHYLRQGASEELDRLLEAFTYSTSINLIDITPEIAKEAGKLGITFSIPSIDSLIAASAKLCNYTNLVSEDSHFTLLEKRQVLKRVYW